MPDEQVEESPMHEQAPDPEPALDWLQRLQTGKPEDLETREESWKRFLPWR